MQTLGASLYCYMHPEIKVIVTAAKTYDSKHYSKGCRTVWQIDFGSTIGLRGELDNVDQIVVL
jgi:hypothetical protein